MVYSHAGRWLIKKNDRRSSNHGYRDAQLPLVPAAQTAGGLVGKVEQVHFLHFVVNHARKQRHGDALYARVETQVLLYRQKLEKGVKLGAINWAIEKGEQPN